ncbi:MAG: hypothetical protein HY744_15080, partial [Deltaproteobacteria bacterium]|nr:hypothetical protein [Deltaproteobacteria bacterium]
MLLDPSLVLGAWCRPLLSGRRVAVLGDSSTGLGELLSETTGRRVHVLDPDGGRAAAAAARARRATGGPVSYGAIEDLDAIAGACDAVLVPDLSAFADPVAAVAAATALASARGFALVASPNTEGGRPKPLGAAGRGPGYYELYDLLSAEFARVRMLGRAPFVACAIADFSAGADPPVTVDASLLAASEEPDWFVALGSEHELEVDPYTVVEVPAAEAVAWLPGAAAGAEPGRESAALAQAERRMAELTAELAELGRRQQEQARRAQQSEQQATAATARLAELQGELDKERVLRHALETQAQEARRAAERS